VSTVWSSQVLIGLIIVHSCKVHVLLRMQANLLDLLLKLLGISWAVTRRNQIWWMLPHQVARGQGPTLQNLRALQALFIG